MEKATTTSIQVRLSFYPNWVIHILGERASLKSNHLKPIALKVKRNHKKRVERKR